MPNWIDRNLSKTLLLKNQDNILRIGQWVLPVTLFLIATGFEILEHLLKLFSIADRSMPFNLTAEIILFGIMGPSAVWFAIAYVRHILDEETRTRKDLAKLNRELESIIADRTKTLKLSNEQLALANKELQALDRLKSEFVSLISHELRAPLTTLNGGLELAMQAADTMQPKAREILEIMIIESQRLTDLVQRILDVSRLESGKLEINPGPVAVRPLIELASNIVLASSSRQVVWNIVKDLPPIWADETYLEQVIRNLIHNADKYSSSEHPLHIYALQQGEQIRIGIKDHGPGIALEDQTYIFNSFSRLHNDENASGGWGLGLHIGKKLVAAQQGSLDVTSPIWDDPQGPGSEFYILMPVAQVSEDELE